MPDYQIPDPDSGRLRRTRDADTAAAYIVAWAILHPTEATSEGVPVTIDERVVRISSALVNPFDRVAVAETLRRLG